MKLLPTIDDSVIEDGSIPSFWYRNCEYSANTNLYRWESKVSFTKWTEANKRLNRKRITKP